MHTFRNALVGAFVVLFPIAYLFALQMEADGKWDSIGSWYTVYSALILALPAALVFALVAKAMLSQWRPRR
jgi:hypothetical protein